MGLLPFYLLSLLLSMTGCKSNDDIIFDHERQQFETRNDRILLEFIAPFGTTADEELYIVGAFNGTDVEGAEPKLEQYKLTKAPNSNQKWGIYLDPSTFAGGKTLADGFRFYSATQGLEYTVSGELATHTDNPVVGSFTNIWGQRWEAYYWEGGEAPEPDHNGIRIYVDDQTGWDALNLYMWGDVNDLNGGWPGMSPTGTYTHEGMTWKYFDMGEENTGLAENLIFNNGGNGLQLPDFAFTLDRDIYLRITAEGVEEIGAEPVIQHDGYALFILNESSQTDLALYAWGDAEAFGGWPGMPVTGIQTINGLEYTYFDLGEANTGLNLNLIPNNNNGGVQWEGGDLNFTIDHDIYLRIFDGGYEVISKDYQGGGGSVTPEPTDGSHKIYIDNQTGWDALGLYAWGDGLPELFGGWPGNTSYSQETVGGVAYQVFTYDGEGQEYHLILNNAGNGLQVDGPAIITGSDYYFTVTENGWTEK